MTELNPKAADYANKMRVRVCGICIKDNRLLLVKHGATIGNTAFWAPPGGGLVYGEALQDCLRREIKEETGIEVNVKRFLFVNEFLHSPLHALEFFFEVDNPKGNLVTGSDPEVSADGQLIEDAKWLTMKEIQAISINEKHRILQHLISLDDLLGMDHYFVSGKQP